MQVLFLQMAWNIELSNKVVTGAPAGGALALMRRDQMGRKCFAENNLLLYTSAGEPLATVTWNESCLVGMGWVEEELLLLVFEDGVVFIYDVLGNFVRSFLLLTSKFPLEETIIQVYIWGSGLVALTSTMGLQVCDTVHAFSPAVYTMPTGLSDERLAISMVILKPCFSSSGLVEVFLGTADGSILVVDVNGPDDQLVHGRLPAPVTSMAIAPNGRFLACFTLGLITVVSTSFTTKVLEFDTLVVSTPLDMQWCGEDSVLLNWKDCLLMVGPYGHWLKFKYRTPLFLIPEVDCCRIISDQGCELLQRVPGPIALIHRLSAGNPPAMLYKSIEIYKDADAKADNVCSKDPTRQVFLSAKVLHVIQANIAAAAVELTIVQQKCYLHAAACGKAFIKVPTAYTEEFVAAARKLRVLNHLRRRVPALCLTTTQYDRLTTNVLLDRLLARNYHSLALRVSEYLGVQRERVIIHWACVKLRSSVAHKSLEEQMNNVCLQIPCYISQIPIVTTADVLGCREFAMALLQSECSTIDQVKLLLAMREHELALKKAAEGKEVDAVYLALICTERMCPWMARNTSASSNCSSLLDTIARHKDLTNLLLVYYQSHIPIASSKNLHNFLVHHIAGRPCFKQAGNLALRISYLQIRRTDRFKKLREVISLYAQGRESQFQRRATEEQVALLEFQSDLEMKFGSWCFFDMSLSETVYNLIVLCSTQQKRAPDLLSDANRLRRRFKIPDRRFSYLKLTALAASGQWQALRVFSAEKSAIGYAPFARVCIEYGQPASEIEYYMNRITLDNERHSLRAELKF